MIALEDRWCSASAYQSPQQNGQKSPQEPVQRDEFKLDSACTHVDHAKIIPEDARRGIRYSSSWYLHIWNGHPLRLPATGALHPERMSGRALPFYMLCGEASGVETFAQPRCIPNFCSTFGLDNSNILERCKAFKLNDDFVFLRCLHDDDSRLTQAQYPNMRRRTDHGYIAGT